MLALVGDPWGKVFLEGLARGVGAGAPICVVLAAATEAEGAFGAESRQRGGDTKTLGPTMVEKTALPVRFSSEWAVT